MAQQNPAIMVAITLAMIFTAAEQANAQQFGSVEEGRKLAREVCTECHAVGDGTRSPDPNASTFEDIANTPGMTSAVLAEALPTAHRHVPLMPNFVIAGNARHDIIAYILSLKKSR